MNINNIELIFDSAILDRGKDHLFRNKVKKISRITKDRYTALVEGSENYIVGVTLMPDGEIRSMNCTCPYAKKAGCKHEAAVLLAIYGGFDDRKEMPALDKSVKKCTKKELEKAVLAAVSDDAKTAARLLRCIEMATTKDVLKWFRLAAEETGEGFASIRLESAVYEALERLETVGDLSEKTRVLLGMLGTMNGIAEEFFDDEDEEEMIFELMDYTAAALAGINDAISSSEDTAAFSAQWTVINSAKSVLPGFCDGDIRWFRILLPFGRDEACLRKMFELAEEAWFDQTECKLLLTKTWCSGREIDRFIEDHIDDQKVLRFAFDRAMEKKDYDSAERFAQLGRKNEHRVSIYWLPRLRDIYIETGNKEKLAEVLYEMTLCAKTDAYEELKKLLSEEEFEKTLKRLLNEPGNNSYEYIIIREDLTDRMIEYCRRNKHRIAFVAKHLTGSRYRNEARLIFTGYIRKQAESARDRYAYSKIAELLCEFLSCFGYKPTERLAEELKDRFSSRTAFLEELSKAGL